jgi:hypothetical protein
MVDFNFKDYMEILGAIVVSLGGSTIIILALSKWFGNIFAEKLIGGIKSKYEKELETTKTELDKAKSQFLRYSEKQFELYNDLWRVLIYTKNQADTLWENANPEQIPSFSEQIRLSKDVIDENMLLIEEEHFDKLTTLINQFEKFQFGKTSLVDLREKSPEQIKNLNLTPLQIRDTINKNRQIKEKYDVLILEIGKSFRTQIKGLDMLTKTAQIVKQHF